MGAVLGVGRLEPRVARGEGRLHLLVKQAETAVRQPSPRQEQRVGVDCHLNVGISSLQV
jgi:hypothetical protein